MTIMRMTMIMTDDEYNNYDNKSLKHYPSSTSQVQASQTHSMNS